MKLEYLIEKIVDGATLFFYDGETTVGDLVILVKNVETGKKYILNQSRSNYEDFKDLVGSTLKVKKYQILSDKFRVKGEVFKLHPINIDIHFFKNENRIWQ